MNTAEASRSMIYAGFWKRVAAYIIDLIIIAFLVYVAISLLAASLFDQPPGLAEEALGEFLVGWFYYAGFEASGKQATPGKMLLGIKVTDLEGEGISFARATARHFGKILSTAILFIGFLMVAFTEKKQGLHDKIAGCLVVNKEMESVPDRFSA